MRKCIGFNFTNYVVKMIDENKQVFMNLCCKQDVIELLKVERFENKSFDKLFIEN